MISTTMEDIKRDFAKVIKYSQGFEPANIDTLFDKWLDAKRDIIEAWGGKFIIEVPETVQFELSPEEKKSRLNQFIDMISEVYDNDELVFFLENVEEDFFSNHLSKDYNFGKDKKIPKGTKIIRAFKYFEKDLRVLEDLQNQASMIIQEDKISGMLCFSVHPLDFISSSENTYHWRSCHALDGDYRAGNLSYMMDKSTIICYLRNGCEYKKLPNFPEDVMWNSKKWRMLLFLSDGWDALFAGRQYPFFSPTALELVQQHFLSSIGKTKTVWTPWYNDSITDFGRPNYKRSWHNDLNARNVMLRGKIYDMFDLVEDGKNSQHFNDLTHSSCYIPYYCWNDEYHLRRTRDRIHFTIGGEAPCLCCKNNHIGMTQLMRCDNCELDFGVGEDEYFAYCNCCERRAIRDDMVWVNSIDELVCPSCYERETATCEECGSVWYICDITYDREEEQYICPDCKHYRETGEKKEDKISYDFIPFEDIEW